MGSGQNFNQLGKNLLSLSAPKGPQCQFPNFNFVEIHTFKSQQQEVSVSVENTPDARGPQVLFIEQWQLDGAGQRA